MKTSLEFFIFLTLPLEIPDKTKLNPWIFHKIVLDPLEIPRPKSKTPGNSTLVFFGHPWKLHFIFNQPLEIPYAISLIPLKIPYPQTPPCLDLEKDQYVCCHIYRRSLVNKLEK